MFIFYCFPSVLTRTRMLHLERYKCDHGKTSFPISFSNLLCLADYESVVILITSLSRMSAGS